MITVFTRYSTILNGVPVSNFVSHLANNMLVDKDFKEAVFKDIGILDSKYDDLDLVRDESKIRENLKEDLTKLRDYLLGQGATDSRIKQESRSDVGSKITQAMINQIYEPGVSDEKAWQHYTIQFDNADEYELLKQKISDINLCSLYTAVQTNDVAKTFDIYASNYVLTTEKGKMANDGKNIDTDTLRLANIRPNRFTGDGTTKFRPSTSNTPSMLKYGNIRNNANWVDVDIRSWMSKSGIDLNEILPPAKVGFEEQKTDMQTAANMHGAKNSLEKMDEDETLTQKARNELAALGIIEGTTATSNIDEIDKEANDLNLTQNSNAGVITDKSDNNTVIADKEKDVPHIAQTTELDSHINEMMSKAVSYIVLAKEVFPDYEKTFDKHIVDSTSIQSAHEKTCASIRKVASHPQRETIAEHLNEINQKRLFLKIKDIPVMQGTIEANKRIIDGYAKEIERIKQELTDSKTANGKISAENRELLDKKQELEDEISSNKVTIETLQDTNMEMVSKFEELEDVVGKLRDALKENIEEKERLASINADYQSKLQRLESIESEVDRLRESNKQLLENNAKLVELATKVGGQSIESIDEAQAEVTQTAKEIGSDLRDIDQRPRTKILSDGLFGSKNTTPETKQ